MPVTTLTDVARRAGAICLAAEPHAGRNEQWPCDEHLAEAARQLSASASIAPGGSPTSAGAIDGAPGVERPPACAGGSTLQTGNRPRTVNPRAAESGPVRPQEPSMP